VAHRDRGGAHARAGHRRRQLDAESLHVQVMPAASGRRLRDI
jgi:hypothetical protein